MMLISTDSALAELRSATRMLHADLERSLAVALPQAGRQEYLGHIRALWGWLAPFEERLWQAPWPAAIAASERAGKRFWIEADLRAAGLDDAAIMRLPQSPFRPCLDSLPERFGVAYVIEGAQLGGQVLRKRLAPALGSWSPRWLHGYGEHTSARWQAFIECAEYSLQSRDARQAAAASARAAFGSLSEWFRRPGAARSDAAPSGNRNSL